MRSRSVLKNQDGQVIVEYVLLLIALISIAFIITGGLIGTGGEPGFIVKTWSGVIKTIAQDLPERPE